VSSLVLKLAIATGTGTDTGTGTGAGTEIVSGAGTDTGTARNENSDIETKPNGSEPPSRIQSVQTGVPSDVNVDLGKNGSGNGSSINTTADTRNDLNLKHANNRKRFVDTTADSGVGTGTGTGNGARTGKDASCGFPSEYLTVRKARKGQSVYRATNRRR
jgi:hypothetical protein